MIDNVCVGCEEAPVRATGALVSQVEGWVGRRLYCAACAEVCEAGLWDVDPDEID